MERRLSVPSRYILNVTLSLLLAVSSAFISVSSTAQMPAPKVEYQQVSPMEIRQWNGFSAQITPIERVQVQPLVGGRIEKILFSDGQRVERGQDLFLIDPRPFEAAVKKAEAALATARAQAGLSAQELKRKQQLADSKLVSQSLFDEAMTSNQVAQAAIMQAESSLYEARLNLEYAHIVAPISGRVGRAELTLGNIVDAGPNAPVLTSIVATDKVYAEFHVDEQTYLALLREAGVPADMPVRLSLSDDSPAVYRGHLQSFDNQLDATSGTIRARAVFENPDGVLTPGMYANVELGSARLQNVYLLPERAIGTNQDKKYVYVIDAQNVVQYREVTLGSQYEGKRVIRSGLMEGDRVAVNGLSHIRPQIQVEPVLSDASTELAINSH